MSWTPPAVTDNGIRQIPLSELSEALLSLIPTNPVEKIRPELRAIANVIVSDLKERFQTNTEPDGTPWQRLRFPRPDGSKSPLNDTGMLAASMAARVTDKGVEFGSALKYAKLMNDGGTVLPANKFLAIPMTIEAKRYQNARQFPRDLFAAIKNAKRGFLGEKMSDGSVVVQYLLVDKAVVPARPFLGVSKRAWEIIERIVFDTVTRESKGNGNDNGNEVSGRQVG